MGIRPVATWPVSFLACWPEIRSRLRPRLRHSQSRQNMPTAVRHSSEPDPAAPDTRRTAGPRSRAAASTPAPPPAARLATPERRSPLSRIHIGRREKPNARRHRADRSRTPRRIQPQARPRQRARGTLAEGSEPVQTRHRSARHHRGSLAIFTKTVRTTAGRNGIRTGTGDGEYIPHTGLAGTPSS